MSKIWIQKSAEWERGSQMTSSPASPHILIDLTCPHCERTNSVAIKRGVGDVTRMSSDDFEKRLSFGTGRSSQPEKKKLMRTPNAMDRIHDLANRAR
jgi:hypothetical protein